MSQRSIIKEQAGLIKELKAVCCQETARAKEVLAKFDELLPSPKRRAPITKSCVPKEKIGKTSNYKRLVHA
jgi:hypothetical protein